MARNLPSFLAAVMGQPTGQQPAQPPQPQIGPPADLKPYYTVHYEDGSAATLNNPAWALYWNNQQQQPQRSPSVPTPLVPMRQTLSALGQAPVPTPPTGTVAPMGPEGPNPDTMRARDLFDSVRNMMPGNLNIAPLNATDYLVDARPQRQAFQEFNAEFPQRELAHEATVGNKNGLLAALGGLLLGGGQGALAAYTGAQQGFTTGADRADAERIRRYQGAQAQGELKYQDALSKYQDSVDDSTRRLAIDTANQGTQAKNFEAQLNRALGMGTLASQSVNAEELINTGARQEKDFRLRLTEATPALISFMGMFPEEEQVARAQALNAAAGRTVVPVPGTDGPDGKQVPFYTMNPMDRVKIQAMRGQLAAQIRPLLSQGVAGQVQYNNFVKALGLEDIYPLIGAEVTDPLTGQKRIATQPVMTPDQQATIEGMHQGRKRLDQDDRRIDLQARALTLEEYKAKTVAASEARKRELQAAQIQEQNIREARKKYDDLAKSRQNAQVEVMGANWRIQQTNNKIAALRNNPSTSQDPEGDMQALKLELKYYEGQLLDLRGDINEATGIMQQYQQIYKFAPVNPAKPAPASPRKPPQQGSSGKPQNTAPTTATVVPQRG